MSSTIATDPLSKPQTPRRRSAQIMKNLRAAVIHNHPIHYKHLLFQAMKEQQMDFVVLFQASQSSIRHEKLPLSQDLYRYRIAYDGPYETAPVLLRARWTWQALQQLSPDFLLISGYHAVECWSAWFWGALHRVPRLMWYESNEFDYKRYWFREIFKRLFLKGCRGAHVYGRSNKAYLAKLGMPAENITIKRAVVDIEKFDTPREDKSYRAGDQTRIIYVGRLAPEKNVPVLLRAFAGAVSALTASSRDATRSETAQNAPGQIQPWRTGMRLIIAGTGPDEAALKRQAIALGIAELVEFKGYIPQKDLGALYRQADFFILPSTREPWGLVALEAMLCRIPVIISTQCGCAADVVTTNTGWTFSPWNEKELQEILERLDSVSPAQLRGMGDAAHELASLYSADECASLVAQSLRGALGASPDPNGLSGAAYAG
jgi:glycosyltransferase involved in cell wall biosynthesis